MLNLLSEDAIRRVFTEAHRVLDPCGRLCLASLTHGVTAASRMVSSRWNGSISPARLPGRWLSPCSARTRCRQQSLGGRAPARADAIWRAVGSAGPEIQACAGSGSVEPIAGPGTGAIPPPRRHSGTPALRRSSRNELKSSGACMAVSFLMCVRVSVGLSRGRRKRRPAHRPGHPPQRRGAATPSRRWWQADHELAGRSCSHRRACTSGRAAGSASNWMTRSRVGRNRFTVASLPASSR